MGFQTHLRFSPFFSAIILFLLLVFTKHFRHEGDIVKERLVGGCVRVWLTRVCTFLNRWLLRNGKSTSTRFIRAVFNAQNGQKTRGVPRQLRS